MGSASPKRKSFQISFSNLFQFKRDSSIFSGDSSQSIWKETSLMQRQKLPRILVTDVHRRFVRAAAACCTRARAFDNQLLTAVARGTLITSRYWPSRNMFTLGTLRGKASPGALASIARGVDRDVAVIGDRVVTAVGG